VPHQGLFLAPLPGKKKTSARGVSHTHPLLCFSLVLLYFIFACIILSKTQKNSFLYSFLLYYSQFIILFPKYILGELSVGSGSIIGKSNIKEFFNHISMHKDIEEKSLVELAPSYEVVSAYLVHMLEARFASLNPFMQHMFLKLHDIEYPEKKAFILKTLHREFRDVAFEARNFFKRFNKLGSHVEVVGTTNEDFRVPIPCKLVGIHDALEKNFN
jgi:hypothetical protein